MAEGLESSISRPSCCGCLWILHFNPAFRRSRPIGRVQLLRNNSLKTEIADGGKHFIAMALGVFDVLDAIARLPRLRNSERTGHFIVVVVLALQQRQLLLLV